MKGIVAFFGQQGTVGSWQHDSQTNPFSRVDLKIFFVQTEKRPDRIKTTDFQTYIIQAICVFKF